MSRGFVKEGDQEEVPMVLPRAFLPLGTPNYVTPEGLKKLHDEMETLKKEWTDAGSNYVTKNYLDAKMRLLSERINSAVLIDNTKANPDVVSFGMYVKYNDKVIRIVGVDEADASKGLISFVSPIAKALIGKGKGDKFEVKVPRGTETIEVQEVNSQPTQTMNQHESERVNISVSSCALVDKSKLVNQHESERIDSVRLESVRERNLKTDDGKPQIRPVPQNDFTEFLPIVNERGNIIGRALHLEIHNGNKLLHPAVQLIIYDSKKEIAAEYWWHVAFGETAEKTLKRKLKEIGSHEETYVRMFQSIKPKFKKQYIREDKNEKELVSVFTAVCDREMEEIDDNNNLCNNYY